MKIKFIIILLALVLTVSQMILYPQEVTAAQPSVKLSNVKGEVIIKRGGGLHELTATDGMELVQGDWLRTGKAGTAKLSYEDGTEATLGATSYLNIQRLTSSDTVGISSPRRARITAWEDGHQSSVELWSGSVWNKVKSLVNMDDKYEVETPTAVMGVRGTLYLVSVDQETGATQSNVIDGAVGVTQNNESSQSTQVQVVTMGKTLKLVSLTGPLPENQVINQQELIKTTQPEILVKIMNDIVVRTQELASTTKAAQESFNLTGNMEDINSAIGSSYKLTEIASFSKEFMSNLKQSDKIEAVKQAFQENNQSIDQVQKNVDTAKTETEQIRSTVVETAKGAGVTQEKIDTIGQFALGFSVKTDAAPATPSAPVTPTIPTAPTTPTTTTPVGGGKGSDSPVATELPVGSFAPITQGVPITFTNGVKLDLGGLAIPFGAQIKADDVTASASEHIAREETTSGLSLAGKVIEYTFTGMTVNSPVRLTIPFDSGVDPTKVGVYYLHNTVWEYQESSVVNGAVVATVNHFSTYAVMTSNNPLNLLNRSITSDGKRVKLTFDEPLLGSSQRAAADFAIEINGSPVNVGSSSIDNNVLYLDLSQTINKKDKVTIAYTVGSTHVRDSNGDSAKGFSSVLVPMDALNQTLLPMVLGKVYAGDPAPTIYGNAEPSAVIKIMKGGIQIATTTADTKGSFTVTISVILNLNDELTITATAPDKAISGSVNITINPNRQSIAITTPASKLSYKIGEMLDITGLVVTGTYSDGSTKAESIMAANVTGFDSTAPATSQILTITIGGKTASYTIAITKAELKSIAITTPATKLRYKVGETLDLSGLVVTGTNMDDSTQIEPITVANVTGFNSTAPVASQILTVTIGGKKTTYIITITKVELKSITITTPAKKLTYKIGETLDLLGLVVTGMNVDASMQIESVTAANVTGFDSTAPANSQTLTITIGGKKTTYIITITKVELKSIAITAPATKLTYKVGESLDLLGLVVTGTNEDDSTQMETVTAANVTGFDSTAPAASQTLTIAIGGKKVSYIIKVVESDKEKPVITLIGSQNVPLANGASYTDEGATAIDNVDGVLTGYIVTTITNNINPGSTLDTSVAGMYTFHYNVSDSAGNKADEVTRTVVVATAAPVVVPAVPGGLTAVSTINVTSVGNPITVANGGTLQMSATITPANATNQTIVWSVATLAGGTATIDSITGLLHAMGVGTVRVTATNLASGVTGVKDIIISAVPLAIADLAATAEDSLVGFAFTAPTGATSVVLEQSADAGATWIPATTGALTAASTTAIATGLTNGTAYQFKLVVIGGTNAGTSNVASATPVATVESVGAITVTGQLVGTGELKTPAVATVNTSVTVSGIVSGASVANITYLVSSTSPYLTVKDSNGNTLVATIMNTPVVVGNDTFNAFYSVPTDASGNVKATFTSTASTFRLFNVVIEAPLSNNGQKVKSNVASIEWGAPGTLVLSPVYPSSDPDCLSFSYDTLTRGLVPVSATILPADGSITAVSGQPVKFTVTKTGGTVDANAYFTDATGTTNALGTLVGKGGYPIISCVVNTDANGQALVYINANQPTNNDLTDLEAVMNVSVQAQLVNGGGSSDTGYYQWKVAFQPEKIANVSPGAMLNSTGLEAGGTIANDNSETATSGSKLTIGGTLQDSVGNPVKNATVAIQDYNVTDGGSSNNVQNNAFVAADGTTKLFSAVDYPTVTTDSNGNWSVVVTANVPVSQSVQSSIVKYYAYYVPPTIEVLNGQSLPTTVTPLTFVSNSNSGNFINLIWQQGRKVISVGVSHTSLPVYSTLSAVPQTTSFSIVVGDSEEMYAAAYNQNGWIIAPASGNQFDGYALMYDLTAPSGVFFNRFGTVALPTDATHGGIGRILATYTQTTGLKVNEMYCSDGTLAIETAAIPYATAYASAYDESGLLRFYLNADQTSGAITDGTAGLVNINMNAYSNTSCTGVIDTNQVQGSASGTINTSFMASSTIGSLGVAVDTNGFSQYSPLLQGNAAPPTTIAVAGFAIPESNMYDPYRNASFVVASFNSYPAIATIPSQGLALNLNADKNGRISNIDGYQLLSTPTNASVNVNTYGEVSVNDVKLWAHTDGYKVVGYLPTETQGTVTLIEQNIAIPTAFSAYAVTSVGSAGSSVATWTLTPASLLGNYEGFLGFNVNATGQLQLLVASYYSNNNAYAAYSAGTSTLAAGSFIPVTVAKAYVSDKYSEAPTVTVSNSLNSQTATVTASFTSATGGLVALVANTVAAQGLTVGGSSVTLAASALATSVDATMSVTLKTAPDATVATATVADGSLVITPVGAGTTTVVTTVTTSNGSVDVTVTVNVAATVPPSTIAVAGVAIPNCNVYDSGKNANFEVSPFDSYPAISTIPSQGLTMNLSADKSGTITNVDGYSLLSTPKNAIVNVNTHGEVSINNVKLWVVSSGYKVVGYLPTETQGNVTLIEQNIVNPTAFVANLVTSVGSPGTIVATWTLPTSGLPGNLEGFLGFNVSATGQLQPIVASQPGAPYTDSVGTTTLCNYGKYSPVTAVKAYASDKYSETVTIIVSNSLNSKTTTVAANFSVAMGGLVAVLTNPSSVASVIGGSRNITLTTLDSYANPIADQTLYLGTGNDLSGLWLTQVNGTNITGSVNMGTTSSPSMQTVNTPVPLFNLGAGASTLAYYSASNSGITAYNLTTNPVVALTTGVDGTVSITLVDGNVAYVANTATSDSPNSYSVDPGSNISNKNLTYYSDVVATNKLGSILVNWSGAADVVKVAPVAKTVVTQALIVGAATVTLAASDLATSADVMTVTVKTAPVATIATAAVTNGSLIITPVAAGTTTVVATVTTTGGSVDITVTINVTVPVSDFTYTINTVAGTGVAGYSGDAGLATSAQLSFPAGVAVDSSDNLYIADQQNNRIRMVDKATGKIATIAGTGVNGFLGDGGLATAAQLYYPYGVAVDDAGNVYIASDNRIRTIDKATGKIATIAGTGVSGSSGDGGLGTAAQLSIATGIAVDSSGNVYIADYQSDRIRMIDKATGIITTIAGTGVKGYSGDGGLATVAQISPWGVAVDSVDIYIVDEGNHCIRMVEKATGKITTIAGTGVNGYSGDGGLATDAQIGSPRGVAIDSSGNIYIADPFYATIRMVDKATGKITTIAGTGVNGSSGGDGGAATATQLCNPSGVAVDSAGNVYIADNSNQIRVLTSN